MNIFVNNFIELEVTKVESLTNDSKAIYFAGNSVINTAKAGQFITFIINLNGKEYRRCYSICTASQTTTDIENNEEFAVAIKRVPGGIVSNYLNTFVKPRSVLKVLAPAGNFIYQPKKQSNNLLLIAGGSGITPILSILKTALTQATNTQISMLYVNKSKQDIMFAQQLDDLAREYEQRFSLVHYLDSEHRQTINVKKSGLLGLLGGKKQELGPGFINNQSMLAMLSQFPIDTNTLAYVCGPLGLMDLAQSTLEQLDLAANNIKRENFIANKVIHPKPDFIPTPCFATVDVNNKRHQFDIPVGKSVLQAAVDAGVDMPFSCREGSCTSCYGTCKSGEIGMLTDEVLSDEELAEGGILPCVAFPKSKKLHVVV